MSNITVGDVYKFFADTTGVGKLTGVLSTDDKSNYRLSQFKSDWLKLTSADRDQIKLGLTDGSLTY
jgi:hypothetical protein